MRYEKNNDDFLCDEYECYDASNGKNKIAVTGE